MVSFKVLQLFNILSDLESDIEQMRQLLAMVPAEEEHFMRIQQSIHQEIQQLEQKKEELLSLEVSNTEMADEETSHANQKPHFIEAKDFNRFKQEKQQQESQQSEANKKNKRVYRY